MCVDKKKQRTKLYAVRPLSLGDCVIIRTSQFTHYAKFGKNNETIERISKQDTRSLLKRVISFTFHASRLHDQFWLETLFLFLTNDSNTTLHKCQKDTQIPQIHTGREKEAKDVNSLMILFVLISTNKRKYGKKPCWIKNKIWYTQMRAIEWIEKTKKRKKDTESGKWVNVSLESNGMKTRRATTTNSRRTLCAMNSTETSFMYIVFPLCVLFFFIHLFCVLVGCRGITQQLVFFFFYYYF